METSSKDSRNQVWVSFGVIGRKVSCRKLRKKERSEKKVSHISSPTALPRVLSLACRDSHRRESSSGQINLSHARRNKLKRYFWRYSLLFSQNIYLDFFLFVFGTFYKIVCREHPGEILTQSHFLMFTFWSKIFFKWRRVAAAATMMMAIKPYNFFFL